MSKTTPAQRLLSKFIEGYNTRDMKLALSLFKDNYVGWGSAKDEYHIGKAAVETQLNRDWSQSELAEITVNFFTPSSNDNWAAADCSVKLIVGGQEMYIEHLRGSIVAANTDGEWKISHMHSSFPDYRNEEGSSFPGITYTCPE